MSDIAAQKRLGMLSTPVVFETSEGPEPGPVADVVNEDTPAPPEAGVSPVKIILVAGAMIVGGYLVLRRLLE